MQISTEINKIFGEEMAKIFANKISDEELEETARKIWDDMNLEKRNWSGAREEPEIKRLVKEAIVKRLYEKIEEILREPINDELLEIKARSMVEMARKIGEETIIRDMANNLAKNVLSVYSRDEKIVQKVLDELNVRNGNGWR